MSYLMVIKLILFSLIEFVKLNNDYVNVGKTPVESLVGIHFGRDNMRVGSFFNGYYYSIPNSIGEDYTPIVLNFNKNGDPIIGKAAMYDEELMTDNICNLQELVGKSFDEIKQMPQFPFKYKLIGKYNKPFIVITRNNTQIHMSLEDTISLLFIQLKREAEFSMNKKLTHVSLSLPDWYNDNAIMSIKAAVNKAGLNIFKTIKDSSSASFFYYIFGIEDERTVLCINTGEHESWLSVNIVVEVTFEVLSEIRLDNFGKINFILLIEEHIKYELDKISNNRNIILTDDILENLKSVSRKIFNQLNNLESVYLYWSWLGLEISGGIEITRAKYEELMLPLIDVLLNNISELVIDCELKRSDLSEIILLGDLYQNVKIRKELTVYFYGKKLMFHDAYSTSILAYGIAFYSFIENKLLERLKRILKNVLRNDLSIEVNYMMSDIVIDKDTVLPTSVHKRYSLSYPNQTKVSLKILEGSLPSSRSNALLGVIELKPISQGLRGFVYFDMYVKIDKNMNFFVTLLDVQSKLKQQVIIRRDWNKVSNEDRGQSSASEKNVKLLKYTITKKRLETTAYEIKGHYELNTEIFNKIHNEVDRRILKSMADEVLNYIENRPFQEDNLIYDLEEKFNDTVKPILKRYF